MTVRKNVKVWGGIFASTVLFVALLAADIFLNKATTASYIYTTSQVGKVIPAEVQACIILAFPLLSAVSGFQFLRYFKKMRKKGKTERETAVPA